MLPTGLTLATWDVVSLHWSRYYTTANSIGNLLIYQSSRIKSGVSWAPAVSQTQGLGHSFSLVLWIVDIALLFQFSSFSSLSVHRIYSNGGQWLLLGCKILLSCHSQRGLNNWFHLICWGVNFTSLHTYCNKDFLSQAIRKLFYLGQTITYDN